MCWALLLLLLLLLELVLWQLLERVMLLQLASWLRWEVRSGSWQWCCACRLQARCSSSCCSCYPC